MSNHEQTHKPREIESQELADSELDGVAGGAIYVKLDDIKGESTERTDQGHKDWINLSR